MLQLHKYVVENLMFSFSFQEMFIMYTRTTISWIMMQDAFFGGLNLALNIDIIKHSQSLLGYFTTFFFQNYWIRASFISENDRAS